MVKSATIVAALLAVPAVALSACSANQKPSTSEGTTPSVWTGSPAPSGPASAAPAPAGKKLTANLSSPDGKPVATATFEFSNGFATITVETTGSNILSPGFHGMHIHKVGKCEANSVAPTGGQPGNFLSAGAHFQVPGHENTHPASGDLSSLQVRGDRSAKLVTTTDAFTADQLLAGGGTAIIIHEKADNFANIPNRYTQGGTPGPDSETLATGDAGARVACGVITG
ncbi:MAG TPA: superoxide dismutase family protein [Mycobacterium sp.]|jgi:Cu-Zn family superoxide dismutase